MKTGKLLWIISFVIIILMFGMIGVHWNDLPTEVPMHFNLSGEADRYGSRSELFILPILGLGLWLLFRWITNKGVQLNPQKYGAKSPQQLEISRDFIAEITLYTEILLALGVYEIMYLAVHGEAAMTGLMLGFAVIGILVILGRYIFRLSRSSN